MKPISRDDALSWMVTLVASSYVASCTYSMSRRVPAFGKLFASLGATVPAPTRLVLAICTPAILWPACVVIVACLVAKELVCERLGTRVAVSVIVFMGTAVFAGAVTDAVFEPMLRLMSQVG
jgi:hypothetical protein